MNQRFSVLALAVLVFISACSPAGPEPVPDGGGGGAGGGGQPSENDAGPVTEDGGTDAGGLDAGDVQVVEQTIGPAGGQVTIGCVTLTIPAGALSAPLAIKATETAASAPPGYTAYSPVFRFEPAGTVFAMPATLSTCFTGEPNKASLFWSKAMGTGFDRLGGTVSGTTLTASISHFSEGFVADGVAFDDPADRTCTRLTLFEGRTGGRYVGGSSGPIMLTDGGSADISSTLALMFAVEDCQGRPVTGLSVSDFVVKENGSALAVESNKTLLPAKGLQVFTSLVLDMSSSTRAQLPQIIAAAKSFVTQVQGGTTRVPVSIQLFAGDAMLREWQAPTLDTALLLSKLDTAPTWTPTDPSSTNLNGAIVTAVGRLTTAQTNFRAANYGGGFTAGYLVLFTDGQDTTGLVTRAAAQSAITSAGTVVSAVALASPEFDAAARTALEQLTSNRVLVAPTTGTLDREFSALAYSIQAKTRASYLLGYCSPKRSGMHTAAVEVTGSVTQPAAQYTFDATGFKPGCSSAIFADVCIDKDCGGLGCGTCDERVGSCQPLSKTCANFCGPGLKCEAETFTNPRGYQQTCGPATTCGSQCVDTSTNTSHCGACNAACASGAECGNSRCVCPLGTRACGGSCIDVTTNRTHCGACNNTCLSTGTCQAGRCVDTLGSSLPEPFGLTLDARHLYYTQTWTGAGVVRVPLDGGSGAVILPTQQTYISAFIEQDDSHLAFRVNSEIQTMPKDGGTPLVRSTGPAQQLAFTGNQVYWMQTQPDGGTALMRAGESTGSATMVSAGVSLTHSYGRVLVVDGSAAYFPTANGITRLPLGGGPAVVLAPLGGSVVALAHDATHLYWKAYGFGFTDPVTMMTLLNAVAIFRVPKTGGQVEQLGSPIEGGTGAYDTGLAVDATHVYWSQSRVMSGQSYYGVFRMPLAGGAVEMVAFNEPNVTTIAINATHVYWIGARNIGMQVPTGRLVRVQK